MVATLGRAVLLVCLLSVVAAVAHAEPEEDRFSWTPGIRLTVVADDEPELEESSKGAIGGWVHPFVELGYRGDAYQLGADLGVDLRRYLDRGSLGAEFWHVSTWGEVGIVPGLSLRMANAYAPVPEQLAAPPDETQNLIQANRFDTELRYWHDLPGDRELLATLGGSYLVGEKFSTILLRDNGTLAFRSDYEPDHLEGRATVELQSPLGRWAGPRTSIYVRGHTRVRSFTESIVSDHGEIGVVAGIRTRRFENVDIEVNGGWGVIAFDDRDTVQRFLGEGRVRVRLPNGWTWRLSAANRFAADVSGNNFVESTASTGVQRYFGDWTSVSASLFISRLENDAWDTDENLFGGAEVRVEQRLGRHTRLSLTYRYWRNDGDFSEDDFDQNRLALELVWRR